VPAGSGTFPNSHHLPRNHSAHAHCQLPAPDPRPGIRRKHCFTSVGTNELEQRPRPGPPGRLSGAWVMHKTIEKENVVLEAGNSLLDGGMHPSLPAASLHAWGKPRPYRTKHAARGRGACPASAIASGNSAAHVGTHRKHQGRWEFGEHEPFGEVCGVGGCPCSTPVSSWSLRPPAPAAAWSKTVKIILQQDRGGRTVNGLWRPQQQASCARPPRRKTRPTHPNIVNRSVRTLAAHASTVTPKRRHVA
jgi:hypothetical protein